MRPTISADKLARLALYEQQVRDFLATKDITVLPPGASGEPEGVAAERRKAAPSVRRRSEGVAVE